MPKSPTRGGPAFSLPPMDPWTQRVLYGLGGLFLVEWTLALAGLPVERLAWTLAPGHLELWPALTRVLVQGAAGTGTFNVVFGLLMLYFFLPYLQRTLAQPAQAEMFGVVWLGATALPLAWWATVGGFGVLYGWGLVTTALVMLVGLSQPNETIFLFGVVPIPAVWFVWLPLLLSSLGILASQGQNLAAVEHLGAWTGMYAWWHARGPGATRQSAPEAPQRKSQPFQVLQGGRQDSDWH